MPTYEYCSMVTTTYNKAETGEDVAFNDFAITFKQFPQLIRCCAVANVSNKDFRGPKSIAAQLLQAGTAYITISLNMTNSEGDHVELPTKHKSGFSFTK